MKQLSLSLLFLLTLTACNGGGGGGGSTPDVNPGSGSGNTGTSSGGSSVYPDEPADVFLINNGSVITNNSIVTLSLNSSHATEMYITNSVGCLGSESWEPYASSKIWTLTQSNASAGVYVKLKDQSGNVSNCLSDTIIHDNIAPTATSITINNDASTTNSTNVSLTITGSGASEMYISNTSTCSGGGAWESYSSTKSWILGQLNATASVFFKLRDEAGNESNCLSDTIIHDSTVPVPTVAGIIPNKGKIAGGLSLTISGTNFQNGMTISLATISCSTVNIISSTQATCITGESTQNGAKDLTLTTGFGTSTLPIAFEYYSPISINPTSSTIAISNNLTFSASGGWGQYSFSVLENNSGSINTSTGIYTAPSASGTFTIRASDQDGNHADSIITVNPALSVSSTSFGIQVNDSRNIIVTGGVPPYSFSTTNGSINSSGLYTAPILAGSSVVTVLDSLNNSKTINVSITAPIASSPTSSTVSIGNQQTFTISGGTTPYTGSLLTTNGSISQSGNTFTFTSTNGYNETIKILDANGDNLNISVTGRRPVNISAGPSSSGACATFSDGSVQCWGNNSAGQLGNNTTTNSTLPVSVVGLTTATSTTTGASHSCSLLSNGTMKCWGNGALGKLCNNSTANSLVPVTSSGSTYSAIGAGTGYSCTLNSSGIVKCCGDNSSYSLGRYVIEQTGNSSHLTQKIPYDVSYAPALFTGLGVGVSTSCAITAVTNLVYCWGNNSFGQLGACSNTSLNLISSSVSNLTNASRVSLGTDHACALKTDRTVMCWGWNSSNQLGASSTICGKGYSAVTVTGLSNISSIALGDNHSCALSSSGTVKCWGSNSNGQLGNNTNTATTSPVSVSNLTGVSKITAGNLFSCALDMNAKIWCWGNNSSGNLGNGSATANSYIPVQVGPWK